MIKNTPALIIDFWAAFCGPCKMIKPTYESMAKANENENIVFTSVNT